MKDSIIKLQEKHDSNFDDSKYFMCKTCKKTNIKNLSKKSRELGECIHCRNGNKSWALDSETLNQLDRYQRILLVDNRR